MAKKVIVSDMPSGVDMDSAKVLGQIIKAKRTHLGLKLVDCAALCGIGINTLSRIENGNANCTLAATFAVLNGLGLKLTIPELNESATGVESDDWV
ncbi:helix-turn-helix domain-containing protein [Ningiella sp. W23]|uniref:helix-turn-helix domain-containing protein n=1 Tax=Ningiella sp. W23 TaxID=3023715 RepID=UPI0037573C75